MASTSLQRQLQQLQTETRSGRRASLLFESTEAARYDTATIFGIGLNGFTELLSLEPALAEFEADLFSEAWLDYDRETKDVAANEALNARLAAFLRRLTPYFLEKAAHKALEYLIRRFKVHVFNVDAVMEMALPHHDSVVFGRLLQILEIASSSRVLGSGSSSSPIWQSLLEAQKAGAPVSRAFLVQLCLKDLAVLRFILDMAARVGAAAAAGKCDPRPVMTFYAVTLTELATRAPSIPEPLVLVVLPYLFQGLKAATIPDFQAATYLILARLASRVAFSQPVFNSTVNVLITHAPREDARHALLCLAALFVGQAALQASGASSNVAEGAAPRWLDSYQLSRKAIKALFFRIDNLAEHVAALAGVHDLRAFLRCFMASGVDFLARKPECGATLRAVLRALPGPAMPSGLVSTLTRQIIYRYRATSTRLADLQDALVAAEMGGALPPAAVAAKSSTKGSKGADAGDEEEEEEAASDPASIARHIARAEATTEALGALLKLLAQLHAGPVDDGVRAALEHIARQSAKRARSGSTAGSGDEDASSGRVRSGPASPAGSMPSSPLLTAAALLPAQDGDGLMKWITATLAGTGSAPLSAGEGAAAHHAAAEASTAAPVHGSDADESQRLTLSLALNHGSSVMRQRAASMLNAMAGKLIEKLKRGGAAAAVAALNAAAAGGVAASDDDDGEVAAAANTLRVIASGLEQGFADTDASVARAALRAAHAMLAAGLPPVLAPLSLNAAPEEAALLRALAMAEKLIALVSKWMPAALTKVNGEAALKLAGVDAAAAAGTAAASGSAAGQPIPSEVLNATRQALAARMLVGDALAMLIDLATSQLAAAVQASHPLAASAIDATVALLLALLPVGSEGGDPGAWAPAALASAEAATAGSPFRAPSAPSALKVTDLRRVALVEAARLGALHPVTTGFKSFFTASNAKCTPSAMGALALVLLQPLLAGTAPEAHAGLAFLAKAAAATAGAAPVAARRAAVAALGVLDTAVALCLAAFPSPVPAAVTVPEAASALLALLPAAKAAGPWKAALEALVTRASTVARDAWRTSRDALAATPGAPLALPLLAAAGMVAWLPAGPGARPTEAKDAASAGAYKTLAGLVDAASVALPNARQAVATQACMASSVLYRVLLGCLVALHGRANRGDVAGALLAPEADSACVLSTLLGRTLVLLLATPEAAAAYDASFVEHVKAVFHADSGVAPMPLLTALFSAGDTIPPLAALRALQLCRAYVASLQSSVTGDLTGHLVAVEAVNTLGPALLVTLTTPVAGEAADAAGQALAAQVRLEALACYKDMCEALGPAVLASPAAAKAKGAAKAREEAVGRSISFALGGGGSAVPARLADLVTTVTPALATHSAAAATMLVNLFSGHLATQASEIVADPAVATRLVREGLIPAVAPGADEDLSVVLESGPSLPATGVPLMLAVSAALQSGRAPHAAAHLLRTAASVASDPVVLWPVAQWILTSTSSALATDDATSSKPQLRLHAYDMYLTALGITEAIVAAVGSPAAAAAQASTLTEVTNCLLNSLAALPVTVDCVAQGVRMPAAAGAALALPAAPALAPLLAALSPALWSACSRVPLSAAQKAAITDAAADAASAAVAALPYGAAALSDALLAGLVAAILRGPAAAASLARQCLARLRLDGQTVARFLGARALQCLAAGGAGAGEAAKAGPSPAAKKGKSGKAAKVVDAAAAAPAAASDSVAASASARFRNAPAVEALLTRLAPNRRAVMDYLAQVTVVAEVLVAALPPALTASTAAPAAGTPRAGVEQGVANSSVLIPALFSIIEALVSLPPALSRNSGPAAASSSAMVDEDEEGASAQPGTAVTWDDEDVVSSCEYATQLLLGVLHTLTAALLREGGFGGAPSQSVPGASTSGLALWGPNKATLEASYDVDLVIHCVQATNSTQTRTGALLLLGSMAALLPARVLARLLPVFLTVGSTTLAREDAFSLAVVQRLVETVVPPLKQHGHAVGVTVHSLLDVFVRCVTYVPFHRQKSLFWSLLSAVSVPTSPTSAGATHPARYLSSLVSLVLAQRMVTGQSGAKVPAGSAPEPVPSSGSDDDVAALGAAVADLLPGLARGGNDAAGSKGRKPRKGGSEQPAAGRAPPAPGTDSLHDMCTAFLHKFTATQQVRSLCHVLLVAKLLLVEAADAAAGKPDAAAAPATSVAVSDEADWDLQEEVDTAALLPLIRTAAPAPKAAASAPGDAPAPASAASTLTPAQRFKLALDMLDFVSGHLASRPFLQAAVAAGEAARRPAGDASLDDVQGGYLIFAQRLFDLLQVASMHAEAATAARGEALADAARTEAGAEARRAAARVAAGFEVLQRYWGSVADGLYGALDKLSALMTPATFVTVVTELLHHPDTAIRRRSLVFFNDYLRNNYGDGTTSSAAITAALSEPEVLLYMDLVGELKKLVISGKLPTADDEEGDDEDEDEGADEASAAADVDATRQIALDSLCILARYFAPTRAATFADVFKAVLDLLVQAPLPSATPLQQTAPSAPLSNAVRASAIMCLGVLYVQLGPRVIPHIPVFLPKVLLPTLEWTHSPVKAPGASSGLEGVSALRMACLVALKMVVSVLPLLLNPYLPRILRALFHPAFTASFAVSAVAGSGARGSTEAAGVKLTLPLLADYEARLADDLKAIAAGTETAVLPALPPPPPAGVEKAVLPPGVTIAAVSNLHGGDASGANKRRKLGEGNAVPAAEAATTGANSNPLLGRASHLPASLAGSAAAASFDVDASAAAQAAAHDVIAQLTRQVPPRVLVPVLLGSYAWAFETGSPFAVVALLRAAHVLIASLSRKEVREMTPLFFRFLLTAFDYRWRVLAPATVADATGATPAAASVTAVSAAAVGSSLVENEAACTFGALLLRLSESQARPVFLRLIQWGTCDGEEVRRDVAVVTPAASSSASGAGVVDDFGMKALTLDDQPEPTAAVYMAFAAMSRRLVLYRTFTALTAVFKAMFLPFFAFLLPEAAKELAALAAAAQAFNGGVDGEGSDEDEDDEDNGSDDSEGEDSEDEPMPLKMPARRGVRFAGDSDEEEEEEEEPRPAKKRGVRFAGDDSDDDDEEEEDSSEEEAEEGSSMDSGSEDEDEEEDAQPKTRVLGGAMGGTAASLPYASLFPLDRLACPSVLHDTASGAAQTLSPSTPHALRCAVLGCVRAALSHDTAPVGGFMASGGRERLDVILKPLVAQFELPLAGTAAAASSASGLTSKLAGAKRAREEATTPAIPGFTPYASAGLPGGAASYQRFLDTYLLPLVGLLVTTLHKDTLWKPINHAVLMLTRDERARVRIAGLRASLEVFTRGEEDAIVLLPETLPFVSEVMHDDDPAVESAANELIRLLEEKSGEDIQSYL